MNRLRDNQTTEYNQAVIGNKQGVDESTSTENRNLTRQGTNRTERNETRNGTDTGNETGTSTGVVRSEGVDETSGAQESERVSQSDRSLSSVSNQNNRALTGVNIGLRISFKVPIRNRMPVSNHQTC